LWLRNKEKKESEEEKEEIGFLGRLSNISAPVFILLNNSNHRSEEMEKYRCTVCGYIYDPAVGDPEHNIAAGTAFDKLPADWICPECGVGKDMFEKA